MIKTTPRMTKVEPNHATLDHLYERFDPQRYIYKPNEERTVLACAECNHSRSNLKLSLEERRIRSGCFPKENNAIL